MKFLRKMLDGVAPKFEKGGPLHKFHALYEAPDTIFFTRARSLRPAPMCGMASTSSA